MVSGRSGLILDAVVEAGNPADSQRFMPMLERHQAHYGVMPRQIAADGGYATAANLTDAKDAGVEDVAFHKKPGLAIADMVKSPSVYRRLRNFRAGAEAGISCLKRAYGLARCIWKGLPHFEAYVWSSVGSLQPESAGPLSIRIAALSSTACSLRRLPNRRLCPRPTRRALQHSNWRNLHPQSDLSRFIVDCRAHNTPINCVKSALSGRTLITNKQTSDDVEYPQQ